MKYSIKRCWILVTINHLKVLKEKANDCVAVVIKDIKELNGVSAHINTAMSKERKASTEKDYAELGYEVPVTDSVKKTPNWVNLVQLDGPLDDSLASKLAYKVREAKSHIL